MKKKIAFLMSVLFLLSSASALAEMPNWSVVIGKKAYSLKYVNDPENSKVIRAAIRSLEANEKIYVKTKKGDWYTNSGNIVDKSFIPEVVYQTEDNNMITYEAKDGKIIEESDFKVDNISMSNNNTVEILFTEKLYREDFQKYFTVGGYIGVERMSLDLEGKKVSIKLNEEISTKRYDLKVNISPKLKNIDGDVFGVEYDEEILLLNKSNLEDEKFDQKVIIMQHGFTGKNILFKRGVTISAPKVTLDNCLVEEINIDPGKGESAKLCNMDIERVRIFSGGANSIHLDNMDVEEIYINSNENTRVVGTKNSQIDMVTLDSGAILETNKSKIKFVKVKDTKNRKKIEFRCDIEKAIVGENSIIESKKKLYNLVIDGDVELSGEFENIEFTDKKSNVDIKSGTIIKNINVKENIKVKAEGNVKVENITGTKKAIEETNKAIDEGEEEYDYTPSNFVYRNLENNGIKVKFKISKSTSIYSDNKYRKVTMSVDFSNDILNEEEILKGIDCQIMNNGEIINYDVLELKDKKAEMQFFIPIKNENRVIIFTEKFMGTIFKLEY